MEHVKSKIRDIPDFPKEGILFKDITPLLQDGLHFKQAIDAMKDRYKGKRIDAVIGIEARGFAIAAPLAYSLETGLVLVRKPGKLPYKTHRVSYELEYGTDSLEIHQDAIKPGQNVLLVDDLLATGGTVLATTELITQLKGTIVEIAFLIELSFLNGREKLKDFQVFSLIEF
ncbi:MAG: adenine phosphoribosyltransferase [Thermodesulfobacteriota bacterium]|nr:adenine phosphoribosyltransferase [Thermodesulfobacteriota bacterium]